MTEQQYIDITNLVKLRSALSILREVHAFDDSNFSKNIRTAIGKLETELDFITEKTRDCINN